MQSRRREVSVELQGTLSDGQKEEGGSSRRILGERWREVASIRKLSVAGADCAALRVRYAQDAAHTASLSRSLLAFCRLGTPI